MPTLMVPFENRILNIPCENRTLMIPSEGPFTPLKESLLDKYQSVPGLMALYIAGLSPHVLNGTGVAWWGDLSGNDYHQIQGVLTEQVNLTPNVIVGKRHVLRGDGSERFAGTVITPVLQPYTIITVWSVADSGINCLLSDPTGGVIQVFYKWLDDYIYLQNLGGYIGYNTGGGAFGHQCNIGIVDGASSEIRENGVLKASGTLGTQPLGEIRLFSQSTGSNAMNGDLALFAVYAGRLSNGHLNFLGGANDDYYEHGWTEVT